MEVHGSRIRNPSPDGHGQCSASKRLTHSVMWDLACGTGRERDRKSHLGKGCSCPQDAMTLLGEHPGLPPAAHSRPAPKAGLGHTAAGKDGGRDGSRETHRLDEGQLLLKGNDAQSFPTETRTETRPGERETEAKGACGVALRRGVDLRLGPCRHQDAFVSGLLPLPWACPQCPWC